MKRFEELVNDCLSLPMSERKLIAEKMFESVNTEIMDTMRWTLEIPKERGEALLTLSNDIWQTDNQVSSRKERSVWARAFVVWQLLNEGYSMKYVITAVGRKRSDCIYMRDKMKFLLEHPMTDIEAYENWQDYIKIIKS